ncbi:MAG: hypothetical protein ACLTXL_13320 [Clostridia bacterium]
MGKPGASWVHVVDLDGALKRRQYRALRAVTQTVSIRLNRRRHPVLTVGAAALVFAG